MSAITDKARSLAEEVLSMKQVIDKPYAADPPFEKWSWRDKVAYYEKHRERSAELAEFVLAHTPRS